MPKFDSSQLTANKQEFSGKNGLGGSFMKDMALLKLVYLASQRIMEMCSSGFKIGA